MNYNNFSKWVQQQLLPNLPPQSVLVVDNASYHNVKLDKDPTTNSRKQEMLDWLTERNIPYESKYTKPELYAIIKQHKTTSPRFKLDTLLSEHGHAVLRLPPYHPELNPIEKIWALVKNWVAARNVTCTMKDVKTLTEERFAAITKDDWASVCSHVDKTVSEFMEKEHILDEALDEMIFAVNTGDSDFETDDEWDSSDDDIDCSELT